LLTTEHSQRTTFPGNAQKHTSRQKERGPMDIFAHAPYPDGLLSLGPSAADVPLIDVRHHPNSSLGNMASTPLNLTCHPHHRSLQAFADSRELAMLRAHAAKAHAHVKSNARCANPQSLSLAEAREQALAQAHASSALDSLLEMAETLSPLWPVEAMESSRAHTVSTTCASGSVCTAGDRACCPDENRRDTVFEATSPRIPTSPQSLSRAPWPTKSSSGATTVAPDVVSSLQDLELALNGDLCPTLPLDTLTERDSGCLWSPSSTACSPQTSPGRSPAGDMVSRDLLNGISHVSYETALQSRLGTQLPCSPVTPSAPVSLENASIDGDFCQPMDQKLKLKPSVRKPKTYAKPVASRFCHICSRMPRRGQGAAVCKNMAKGLCRKIVCERCIVDNGWNYAAIKSNVNSWLCPHCAGLCPARSQCHIYNRINARRKRAEDVTDDGCALSKSTSAITSMSTLQASCLASADLASTYAFLLGPNQVENDQTMSPGGHQNFPGGGLEF
jgi:hypothetical protein